MKSSPRADRTLICEMFRRTPAERLEFLQSIIDGELVLPKGMPIDTSDGTMDTVVLQVLRETLQLKKRFN